MLVLNPKITVKESHRFNELKFMAEDVAPVRGAKIVATILYSGESFAYGVNRLHSHPFQAKYGKNSESIFWHAETNAVFNFLRRYNKLRVKFSDFDVMVVRAKRSKPKGPFVFGNAKPCFGCMTCLKEYGFNRVIFSNGENTLLDIDDLK